MQETVGMGIQDNMENKKSTQTETKPFKANDVIKGMFWKYMERFGAQGISFLVQIVLARLLNPQVYGSVALVTVFISIFQLFIDSGLGNSLIQKKDADHLDFSTVFYFNIISSVMLYVGLFIIAPVIASVYRDDSLTQIIRVLSLTLIFAGLKNIQQAYATRYMLFKKFFFSTLGGTIGSAVIGIVMAYMGFGIWALVAQSLFNSIVDTVILWFTVRWRPEREFSFIRLGALVQYGWKILMACFIDTVYNNLRQFMIGKFYSSAELAYYNRGNQVPVFLVTNINSSFDSVLLPAMARVQEQNFKIKEMMRRAIKTSVFIIAPVLSGLAFTSEVLVEIILTEKWLPCVPYLKIFCIVCMFYPIHTINLNAIKALGRSDILLFLEIVKKIAGAGILFATMWRGPIIMAYGAIIVSLFSQGINAWACKRLFYYSYLEQLKDVLPSLCIAVCMGFCINFLSNIDLCGSSIIAVQIAAGVFFYFTVSSIFRIESLGYLKSAMKKEIHSLHGIRGNCSRKS